VSQDQGWPERSGAGRPRCHPSPKGEEWPPSDLDLGPVQAGRPGAEHRGPDRAAAEAEALGDRSVTPAQGELLTQDLAGVAHGQSLTDDALEGRLYGLRTVAGSHGRPWPDCAALHAERRQPGVTLELLLARADGTYIRLLGKLARVDVLLIDDWGLAPVTDQERRDLLEILEDRYGDRSYHHHEPTATGPVA
jgi:hypothetical protein